MVAPFGGGAHYGTRDWLAQRATAVYMLLFLLLAFAYLVIWPPARHAEWQAFMSRTPVRIATLLFWLSVFVHSWVGVRNVLMDYIKSTGARLALHLIVIVSLLALFFWAVQILWGL